MENQSKMKVLKRIGIIAILLIPIVFAGMIIFSPYGKVDGFNYKIIKNTVHINAPVDSVFLFLGNSAKASEWSVFVDHINTLNSDSFPDGSTGSRRRCFINSNENGMQWDELITEVISNKKRQLTIYNLKDFKMTVEDLATEQLYEATSDDGCQLTFTVFFLNNQPTILETLKTYFAAYQIKSIFEDNMNNIKHILEKENNGSII